MNKITKPREIYYDINIHNEVSSGNKTQPLRFSETRDSAIVKVAGDYSLSIVRFQLDTFSLPTFIADIEPFPNTDVNKMIETVTLDYKGTTVGPLNLIWIPTNLHIQKPNPLSATQLRPINSEYYYGNSFRHYCDLVNNALITLTNQLKTIIGSSINSLLPPFLLWNDDNQTTSLMGQVLYYEWSLTDPVNIYFNRPLHAKFTSLPALKNYNNTLGKIYKIYMKSDNTTKLVQLNSQTYVKTDQEYSTISNWSPLSSICFTSNNLPIYATQVSQPITYYNGVVISNNTPNNSEPIITDMATSDMVYKPNLLYVPGAQYRFIDMYGTSDIKSIDINVYWRDKQGVLFPFYLQSEGSCSLKLLFKLKD